MEPVNIVRKERQDFLTDGPRRPKVLAVTSGKGGVGKTNVVANLAVSLSQLGRKVMVLDADLGLGNLDILFGLVPPYTLEHVLTGERPLSDVVVTGPCGIQILPAGSGLEHLTALTKEQKLLLLSEFDRLERDMDVFLIDTSAGISGNVLYFSVAAEEIIVVASPEPTSLTDAYATMKVLSRRYGEKRFKLLVNLVKSEAEARETFRKLCLVADHYLDISIEYIGCIPEDDFLKIAVSRQRAVVEMHPRAKSSQAFGRLARKVSDWPPLSGPKGNVQFLWRRFLADD